MTFERWLIQLSAIFSVIAFVAAVRWARGRKASERTFRWAYHGIVVTLAFASVQLMVAILRHDFRFQYVVDYSSRDLPLLYLISAFWAGQPGTYLLWALIGALVGYSLYRRKAWEPAMTMAFWIPTVGFMQLLMLNASGNPFRTVQQIPPDGHGLNPLLQDPWMASHPPLIFLGYVALTVPAVLALTALTRRRFDEWLAPALRWSLASFVTLGAGIILGGFWAYKVLGWGGYWAWDPVENASLIPWLVATCLIHGLLVQRAKGALPRTNLGLALAGYVLVFYATFLTRSGVLADFSVHSFPAGSIYWVLLAIQLFIPAVSVLFFLRCLSVPTREIPLELSWPTVLSVAVTLFGLSAAMVLIGTSWPIISSWLGEASSLGQAWYNRVSIPIYFALLVLLAVAPLLAWIVRPWELVRARAWIVAGVAAAGTAAAVAFGARGTMALLLLWAGLGALTANVLRLIEMRRGRLLGTGAPIAHAGFALMLIGVVGSSFWSTSHTAMLPQGVPTELMGRSLTYLGHVDGSEPFDRWRIELQEPGREAFTADVQMFRTGKERDASVMHRPAILRHLGSDLYIAPTGLQSTGTQHQTVELYKGQETAVGQSVLTFVGFDTHGMGEGGAMTVQANVDIRGPGGEERLALPLTMTEGQTEAPPVRPTVARQIESLQLERMSVEEGLIQVHADVQSGATVPALAVEVSQKPMMSVLWAGTILLGLGCGVAWQRRRVDARLEAQQAATAPTPPPARAKKKKKKRRATPQPAVARR